MQIFMKKTQVSLTLRVALAFRLTWRNIKNVVFEVSNSDLFGFSIFNGLPTGKSSIRRRVPQLYITGAARPHTGTSPIMAMSESL